MRTLGMEPARGEMGLESACDAILERIERQARLSDIDDVHGSSGRAGSLQRKISSLQEQLTNKDLHLDLLRKKVRLRAQTHLLILIRTYQCIFLFNRHCPTYVIVSFCR